VLPKSKPSRPIKEAVKAAGVSPRSVERQKGVRNASPGLNEQIARGEKTLAQAEAKLHGGS
jgi:hypothetical protein